MSETRQDANAYLAAAPVGKLLLKFSIPCAVHAGKRFVQHCGSDLHRAERGVSRKCSYQCGLSIYGGGIGPSPLVGDGSAAFLSLSLGSGDQETSHRCIGNGIVLSAVVGIVLMIIGLVFTDPILHLFGVTEACYAYAWDYMRIILLGIPFYIFTSGMNAAIRADGSPGYSMVATVLGAVINLILDPVSIFIFHMGVKGAAIATIIGQIASCIMTAAYFHKPKSFRFQKQSFRLHSRIARRICQLGVSSFITQIAIVVIISVANNMIVLQGPQSPLWSGYSSLCGGNRDESVWHCDCIFCGIAVGGQPVIGYNHGAGNFKRVFSVYRLVILANIAVGAISMLLFECCPQVIVHLFGSESDLYNEYANLCFRIYLGGILLCCIQKASSIFLQAIGKPVKATVLSLSRDVVFLVPGVVILSSLFGVTGMLWRPLWQTYCPFTHDFTDRNGIQVHPPKGGIRGMQKRIATISREFGSGGRSIGRLVAQQLGVAFYDKELVKNRAGNRF